MVYSPVDFFKDPLEFFYLLNWGAGMDALSLNTITMILSLRWFFIEEILKPNSLWPNVSQCDSKDKIGFLSSNSWERRTRRGGSNHFGAGWCNLGNGFSTFVARQNFNSTEQKNYEFTFIWIVIIVNSSVVLIYSYILPKCMEFISFEI